MRGEAFRSHSDNCRAHAGTAPHRLRYQTDMLRQGPASAVAAASGLRRFLAHLSG
jgi:hypothetical protein